MKKIFLIGDSIRQGYDKYIKMAFDGVAEVYYPKENCRFTTYIIRNVFQWKQDAECGDDIDLVHWNAGLWDDLVMPDGEYLISKEDYARNVERIYKLLALAFPKAKIVFATSTPVQENLFTTYKRYNAVTEQYNAEAVRIARENGAEINDLYALVKDAPKSYYSDLTHLYTKDGTRLVTEKVRHCIEEVLGIQGRELDYDEIFGEKDSVLGI
jgi:hypothetical protein